MTNLSVNINKVATLRNARGGNEPDVVAVALDCERFGADGITVHPRPDERHIRYQDVLDLKPQLKTEFNIEGYPSVRFLDLVCSVVPTQVTLVPDSPEQITSNSGWDTRANQQLLTDIVARLHEHEIRASIFIDPMPQMAEYAALTGADRIELYTEPYARLYPTDPASAIRPFIETAHEARSCGLAVNAGHDLSLRNLGYFINEIPFVAEVSIGHQLICDALYLGLNETIKQYKQLCKN